MILPRMETIEKRNLGKTQSGKEKFLCKDVKQVVYFQIFQVSQRQAQGTENQRKTGGKETHKHK